MDAGAGTGVLQWYLADGGADVISVDRLSRSHLALRFRNRFKVHGLRPADLASAGKVFRSNFRGGTSFSNIITRQTRDLIGSASIRRSPGQVTIYNQDLKNLVDIPDNSIDAVVAVSALEHNQPEGLGQVVSELLRVLKPGAPLLATLTAGHPEDWWHEPSSGWCYTDDSLRRLFQLDPDTPSNYDRFEELLTEIVNCAELRDGLARFYFQTGNNGMPWGRWEPQYSPVGVCKIKPG
jgi:SAM-dependent methyltransferase